MASQPSAQDDATGDCQAGMGVLPLTNALFVAFRAAVRARAQNTAAAPRGGVLRLPAHTGTRK